MKRKNTPSGNFVKVGGLAKAIAVTVLPLAFLIGCDESPSGGKHGNSSDQVGDAFTNGMATGAGTEIGKEAVDQTLDATTSVVPPDTGAGILEIILDAL